MGGYRPSATIGPSNPQPGGQQFQTGQAPPGGQGSPNLSVNPYLSPYMGMFAGTGPDAQLLFATPSLSPLQQSWIARMGAGARGSANAGNIPLSVMSPLPPPPPSPETAPTRPTGPAPSGPGTEELPPGWPAPPPGKYYNPSTGTFEPFPA
jgi:hypothetical protein